MSLLKGRDMTGVKAPKGDFQLLPNGLYMLMITEQEEKENAKKNGHYLMLKTMVMEPEEFDGVTFKDYLNLDNPSVGAVKAAESRLQGYFEATGGQVDDASEMIGIPFIGKVIVVPKKDENGFDSNKIVEWWHIDDDPRAAETKVASVQKPPFGKSFGEDLATEVEAAPVKATPWKRAPKTA